MAKFKALTDTHREVARHLDFLSRSPAYKGYDIITWSTGGQDYILAAADLSDRGFMGVETNHLCHQPLVTISIARYRIPELMAFVEQSLSEIAA
ncbi:hypothetical protein [Marinobacter sp.]|uniref:hypothetical protein n=1 Tax=Marinobacter sp. TaxID=50741 RepID=UPI00356AD38A